MSNTVFDNLDRLHNASLAITAAITAKGGTVNQGDGFEDYSNDIATIPTGLPTELKDVDFIDYDGTVLRTYTKAEFLALSTMPPNPSHTGLIAQGWNWTLADAKAYVTKYGALVIGQTYATSDGKTRIYIKLDEHRTSPKLQVYSDASGTTLDVDWGDGTQSTITGSSYDYIGQVHNYTAPGNYVISFAVTAGKAIIKSPRYISTLICASGDSSTNNGDFVYAKCIQKIEIGTDISSLGYSSLTALPNCKSITIPNNITGPTDRYAFRSNINLKGIVLPNGITDIGEECFYGCTKLEMVSIPKTMTDISYNCGGEFQSCVHLRKVTMPEGRSKIANNTFYACGVYAYPSFRLVLPDTIVYMTNYAFYGCAMASFIFPPYARSFDDDPYSQNNGYIFSTAYITEITIPNDVSRLTSNMFQNCTDLHSVTLPTSQTITDVPTNCFDGCNSLTEIDIPEGYTTIGDYAFNSCTALSIVRIPSTVTSIGRNAFRYLYLLDVLQFKGTTPPTASQNAFGNISSNVTVLVPVASYASYLNLTNYPSAPIVYLGFGTYSVGENLPSTVGTFGCTWYATVQDARSGNNPITVGNGGEVYADMTYIT